MTIISNVCVGIEIECVINKKHHSNLKVGTYHQGIPVIGMAGWKAERDASVRCIGEFDWDSKGVEFVSCKVFGKKSYQNILNNFKKYMSKNGQLELYEVMSCNSSCGNHIHFGIKDFRFQDKIYFMHLPKIRAEFFKMVKASNIQSKNSILKHYHRSMAKRFAKNHMINKERRVEFNFHSEDEGKGLELRGVNLLGLRTWAEFDEMFEIIWKTLEILFTYTRKWEANFWFSKTGYELIENMSDLKISIPLHKIKETENINLEDVL